MAQNGIDMDSNSNINLYSRKKELFYCLFEFNKTLDEALIIRFLILLDKLFPEYELYVDFKEVLSGWRDLILKNRFKFDKSRLMTFYIAPPFYIQESEVVKIYHIKDGVTFSFAWDKTKECYNLIFNLYADVVTDKVYFLQRGKYIEKNQSVAAKKNRKLLSDCLKETEKFLSGEIIEYFIGYHLAKDSGYKYGIKENARHITDHMDF